MLKTRVYIDGANLYKSFKSETETLDYAKFYQYLKDKYNPEKIYLFTGFIPHCKKLYDTWTNMGYIIRFKETFRNEAGEIKGNVDAEIVLQSVEESYEESYECGILVSGDGDFSCLIDFWKRKEINPKILAPKLASCSYFLRKQNVSLIFLDNERLKPKLIKRISEKAPDRD